MTPARLISRILTAATLCLGVVDTTRAQEADGNRAFAERSMQAYLSMWDGAISEATVNRFYAARVIYYGKSMSRAQVLADKRLFSRNYPSRRYTEIPGTFAGKCNADRSRCEVSATVAWRRVDRANRVSTGRAKVRLEFVPAEGTRKIAHESARIL